MWENPGQSWLLVSTVSDRYIWLKVLIVTIVLKKEWGSSLSFPTVSNQYVERKSMSKAEQQLPEESPAKDQAKEALRQFFQIVFDKGKSELRKRASEGRKVLEVRTLQRDRLKMFEKLGREVEMLVEAGDINHPGLIRGVQRIHELDKLIEELKKSERK